MKGFGKKDGIRPEGVRTVPGTGTGRRVAAGVAAFFVTVLLVAEVIVAVSYVVPTMAVVLYQYSTIKLHETIALGDFAVRDMVFLTMLYGAPLFVGCMLAACVEWQVMKKMGRLIWRLVMISVGRGAGRSPAGKGDDGV